MAVVNRSSVPTFSPALSSIPVMPHCKALQHLVLSKIINAERASYHAPKFLKLTVSWALHVCDLTLMLQDTKAIFVRRGEGGRVLLREHSFCGVQYRQSQFASLYCRITSLFFRHVHIRLPTAEFVLQHAPSLIECTQQINLHTYIQTHTYIHTYVCVCVCMCGNGLHLPSFSVLLVINTSACYMYLPFTAHACTHTYTSLLCWWQNRSRAQLLMELVASLTEHNMAAKHGRATRKISRSVYRLCN